MMLPFFISVIIIIIIIIIIITIYGQYFLHGSFTSASAILTKELAVTYNVTQLNHSKL